MSRSNYSSYHNRYLGNLNSEYYTNPKEGFDKAWHDNRKRKAEKNHFNDENVLNGIKYNKQTSNYKKQRVTAEIKNAVAEARAKLGYK